MQATLTAIDQYSDSVISFSFQPERPVDYIAGQFVEVTLLPPLPPELHTKTGDAKQRWFTLSSSPTEKEITITVRYGGTRSSFKQSLQKLAVGSRVHISDALGDFVLPLDTTIPLVWLAAGIGITPFRSMAVWIADNQETRQVSLFRKSSDADAALFADVMKRAGVQEPALPADSETSARGNLSATEVLEAIPGPADSMFYIAGPEGFVTSMSNDLKAAGIATSSIINDVFIGYS
jgi:ferredoxin-NADP reductase